MSDVSNKDNKVSKHKIRLLFLSSLIVILLLTYICQAWLVPTLSRYIKREQDEIRAHYTTLYIDTTGHGKTIALEDGVGYVDFDLRNYIGENVTQRDIVYTISKPTVFYDSAGKIIQDQDGDKDLDNEDYRLYLSKGNKLHVLDVWGNAQVVSSKSYLYNVDVVKNNGEVVSEGVYTFTYENLGSSAKGKVHNLTCKVTHSIPGAEPENDEISIVVQLTKPYKEVLIINMKVSNKLIVFSQKEVDIFNVLFDKLYIQSADLYSYHKNGEPRTTQIDNSPSYYKYTPYAFKLTLYWSGYILDEEKLEEIHIGTSTIPGFDKNYDTVGPNGLPSGSGSIPNPNTGSPYLDIKKATIARINSIVDNGGVHRGEMVLFVPQGSDINMHFIKTSTSGSIDVKVEVYATKIDYNISTSGYYLYDENFGGYTHNYNDGEYLYNLFTYPKS